MTPLCSDGAKAQGEMANEAEFNREQQKERVDAFALMEPVGKIAAWPKRLQSFFHDVRVEMRHVNWPSRADVISTTIVVTVTVAFFGVYFFLTDSAFSRGIGWLIEYAKKHS